MVQVTALGILPYSSGVRPGFSSIRYGRFTYYLKSKGT